MAAWSGLDVVCRAGAPAVEFLKTQREEERHGRSK